MKIRQHDYLGLALTRASNEFRQKVEMSMLSDLGSAIREDPRILSGNELLRLGQLRKLYTERILSPKGYTHYLLTPQVREIASNIKVTQSFNYQLLTTLKAQQSCYLLGKDEFFRFIVSPPGLGDETDKLHVIQGGITIMHMVSDHANELVTRTSFFLDYEKGLMSTERLNTMHWELAVKLIQLIIFVEMSEPELLVVAAHSESKNRKAPLAERIENKTDVAITRVHSNWNKFIVHTEDIGVKGFLRLQPCGPQWSQRKLTWVRAHIRKGFIRRAPGGKSLTSIPTNGH